MASLTIRRLDDSIKARLRARAAHRGRSMEEEAREILKLALAGESPGRRNLADSIRKRFSSLSAEWSFRVSIVSPSAAPKFGK